MKFQMKLLIPTKYIFGLLFLMGCGQNGSNTDGSAFDNSEVADQKIVDSSVTAMGTDGLQRINAKNGCYMEGMLVSGKRSGAWVAFFPDGTIQSKGNYSEGVEVGPTEVYYPNGSVYYTGQFDNGKPTGEWVFFGEDGKETKRVTYDADGKPLK